MPFPPLDWHSSRSLITYSIGKDLRETSIFLYWWWYVQNLNLNLLNLKRLIWQYLFKLQMHIHFDTAGLSLEIYSPINSAHIGYN